jgi:hypothetical protein
MGDYLFQHRRLWYVRVQIPKDVQHLFGQAVIRKSTGTDSRSVAKTRAAPIVASVKYEIDRARETLRPPPERRVEDLAKRFKELQGADAERFVLTDVVKYVLAQTGQTFLNYSKELPSYGGLAFRPGSPQQAMLESITGRKTPFLQYFDDWAKQVAVAPKTRDEYASAIREFASTVKQGLEDLRGSHVQRWVNALLTAEDDEAIDALTVNKKLSGLRNYWDYLRSLELVEDDRKPFHGRTVRNPPERVKIVKARYETGRGGTALAGG